jgi:hypothetical protein
MAPATKGIPSPKPTPSPILCLLESSEEGLEVLVSVGSDDDCVRSDCVEVEVGRTDVIEEENIDSPSTSAMGIR